MCGEAEHEGEAWEAVGGLEDSIDNAGRSGVTSTLLGFLL